MGGEYWGCTKINNYLMSIKKKRDYATQGIRSILQRINRVVMLSVHAFVWRQ